MQVFILVVLFWLNGREQHEIPLPSAPRKNVAAGIDGRIEGQAETQIAALVLRDVFCVKGGE